MAEDELLPGRGYWMKTATQTVTATVQHPTRSTNTLEHLVAPALGLNAIGVCGDRDRPRDRVRSLMPSRVRAPTAPSAASSSSTSSPTRRLPADAALRAPAIAQHPSPAPRRQPDARDAEGAKAGGAVVHRSVRRGKSTIANLVEKKLVCRGCPHLLLDGDNVRHGLNRDLGFTEADLIEEPAESARLRAPMADAGLTAAFISPFRAERHMVRRMIPDGVSTKISKNSPSGMMRRTMCRSARNGEMKAVSTMRPASAIRRATSPTWRMFRSGRPR